MTNAQAATVAAKEELGIVPSFKDAGISNKIVKRVEDRQRIKTQMDALKQELDDLNGEITVELAKAGATVVMVGRYRVNLVASSNSTLNKEKLLEAGVPAETIVECTVTKNYEYVQVTDTEKGKVTRKEKKLGVKSISSKKSKR